MKRPSRRPAGRSGRPRERTGGGALSGEAGEGWGGVFPTPPPRETASVESVYTLWVYDRVYGGAMRTNIVLDDELLAEAARLSGIKTKKELVNEALRLFIATKKRKSLLDLRGKIELAPGYDYKGLRSRQP